MKVAIHQPHYWPWAAYLHKALSADVFVYLDVAQFSKNGFQNRNRIKTRKGAAWLTLPVQHRFGQTIAETLVAGRMTLEAHGKTIRANYAGTAGFQRWTEDLDRLFGRSTASLSELAIASTEWMLDRLGATVRRVRASELPGIGGSGSKLIASICSCLDASAYLSGTGALGYMNVSDFSSIGCAVSLQEWCSPVYEQAHTAIGFIPDLSALDLLLNCPESAATVIRAGGTWKSVHSFV